MAQRPAVVSPALIICLALIALTTILYGQVIGHDFIRLDDDKYVTENIHVQRGLNADEIKWAFTKSYSSNWHPLTWISHIIDFNLYGMNPFGHHLTSVLFHIANTLLLFLVLRRMTGSVFRSGFVAALFAVHPLHVESVAWVAERKDVLSTFFLILTIWAYTRYTENPGLKRYLPVFVLLALGLMSKPMLVTLPFILLAMDFWPLGRMSSKNGPTTFWKLVFEKIPLFVLVIASSVITYLVQQSSGAVKTFPLVYRIGNAAISYIAYLVKMVWPSKLAVYYPYSSESIQIWKVAASILLMALISYAAVRLRKERPYILAGWLFYVIAMIPVIGIVQVGGQAMADRYTYIPLIGVFIAITWAIPDALGRIKIPPLLLPITSVAVIGILSICTWTQIGYWKNSITLFERTLSVTENNFIIENNLGKELNARGDIDGAARHYKRAIKIVPNDGLAYNNLGMVLEKQGKSDEAMKMFYKAMELSPRLETAHYNMGSLILKKGDYDKSIEHLKTALKINPGYFQARNNLAVAYYRSGRYEDAWNEIKILRKSGIAPSSSLLEKLSKAMPDPGN